MRPQTWKMPSCSKPVISRYLLSPLHCVACFQSVFSHTSTRTTWIKLVGRLWFRSGFSRDHFFNGQVTNVLQFWHWWTWIFTIFRNGLPPPFPCRKWLRLSQFISHFIMVSSLGIENGQIDSLSLSLNIVNIDVHRSKNWWPPVSIILQSGCYECSSGGSSPCSLPQLPNILRGVRAAPARDQEISPRQDRALTVDTQHWQ